MDQNPTSPDRPVAHRGLPGELVSEQDREEKSWLPEIFKKRIESVIMVPNYNMPNNKEQENRTPASHPKVGFETERQLKREPFRDIKQKLETTPEKVSDIEISLEKHKPTGSAIEAPSTPLSTEKSLRNPTTEHVYQPRPLRTPGYLEKEREPGSAPSRPTPLPYSPERALARLDEMRRQDPKYASKLAREAEVEFDRKWGTTDPSAPTEWGIMHTYDD
jgi:hypothetical protein